jgi:hypothetical protein
MIRINSFLINYNLKFLIYSETVYIFKIFKQMIKILYIQYVIRSNICFIFIFNLFKLKNINWSFILYFFKID